MVIRKSVNIIDVICSIVSANNISLYFLYSTGKIGVNRWFAIFAFSHSDTCKCIYVHNIQLKERSLCHFPHMQAQKVGRSYLLLISENVGDADRAACETNCIDDELCLCKAAKIVRGEMLKHSYLCEGTFENKCQVTFHFDS